MNFSVTSINTQVKVSIQVLCNIFSILDDGTVSGQFFLFISPDDHKYNSYTTVTSREGHLILYTHQ